MRPTSANCFDLLHEAWRSFSRGWGVDQQTRHPGILALPDPGTLSVADAARLIDELLRSEESVENRLLVWKRATGWREVVR